jgi:hypothetical protein
MHGHSEGEGEMIAAKKSSLRGRIIAMRRRRHRLSMRDRLRHRRRLVEIGLKAKK